MSPKIPPFPPREFATIDEVLANIPAGVAQGAPLVPSSRADVPGKVYIAGGGPGALDLHAWGRNSPKYDTVFLYRLLLEIPLV